MPNSFFSRVGALKLKELPEFVRKTAVEYPYRERFESFSSSYKKTYIDTGSVVPLWHFMTGVFGIAYVTVWPSEYRHMMAAKRASERHGHH